MADTVIFSKHFPKIDPMEALEAANLAVENDPNLPAFMRLSPTEMLERVQKKYTFKPNQEKACEAETLIALAKEFCYAYDTDTEIRTSDEEVSIDLWIPFSIYAERLKRELTRLIDMADELSFTPVQGWPYGFCLTLTLYVADRYLTERTAESTK